VQVQGQGGLVARDGYFAATVTRASRQPRDVAGDKLLVGAALVLHPPPGLPAGALPPLHMSWRLAGACKALRPELHDLLS